MNHLPGLHLNAKHPQICCSLYGETIEELSEMARSLSQQPVDIFEFRAASFNGISNFSQIGNALLLMTSPLKDQPIIFSCAMDELPEYFRTESDYKTILLFAVRSGLIDAVEIDYSSLDRDGIDEIADEAFTADVLPILTIHCGSVFSEPEFADTLFSAVTEDISIYHIICPIHTEEEALECLEAIHACTAAHEDAHFIIETVGEGGKALLKSGNTLASPILYAAPEETADRLSIADLSRILANKKA